jgi:hypothetical protein
VGIHSKCSGALTSSHFLASKNAALAKHLLTAAHADDAFNAVALSTTIQVINSQCAYTRTHPKS